VRARQAGEGERADEQAEVAQGDVGVAPTSRRSDDHESLRALVGR
jgi:hypothetical protein